MKKRAEPMKVVPVRSQEEPVYLRKTWTVTITFETGDPVSATTHALYLIGDTIMQLRNRYPDAGMIVRIVCE